MSFVLSEDDMKGLDDGQKDAVFEALFAALVADGTPNQEELAQFEAELDRTPWGMDRAVAKQRLFDARKRVVALADREQLVAFIKDVAERLPAGEVREKVFRAMAQVMVADQAMTVSEQALLRTFAQAFGLSADRLKAIKADVESA